MIQATGTVFNKNQGGSTANAVSATCTTCDGGVFEVVTAVGSVDVTLTSCNV